jgi:hypothetical protein
MNVPVKDETNDGDIVRETVNLVCDRMLSELGPHRSRLDIERVLEQVCRWYVRTALAWTDGNAPAVVGIAAQALNEPQNERLVHAFLERLGQEAQIPAGPVH